MEGYVIARVISPREGYVIVDAASHAIAFELLFKTREDAEKRLIRIGFGPYAEEIIARMECGESFDSAVQSVLCEVFE